MSSKHYGGRVHAAGNLVDYIVDRISIIDNAAFVDVVANKNDLGHYRRVIRAFPLLVDTVKLFHS